MKSYNRENIPRAKALRKEMTPWERKLWYTFLRYYPIRFQRQKAIDNYIVDFYCAQAKLIIELDGSGHYEEEQERYDTERDRVLRGMGFKILRIYNLDVDRKFKEVCERIEYFVNQGISLPQSTALPAPSSEGAKS